MHAGRPVLQCMPWPANTAHVLQAAPAPPPSCAPQGGAWVGVHSAKANAMVRALLQAQALPGLPPYTRIRQEVKFGTDGKSRVDFVLHWEVPGGPSHGSAAGGSTGGGDLLLSSSTAAAAVATVAAAAEEGASGVAPASKRRRGSKAAPTAAAAAAAAGAAVAAAVGLDAAVENNCCYLEVKASTLAEDRPNVSRCGEVLGWLPLPCVAQHFVAGATHCWRLAVQGCLAPSISSFCRGPSLPAGRRPHRPVS